MYTDLAIQIGELVYTDLVISYYIIRVEKFGYPIQNYI